eukprot:Hpha_TRINITY_DN6930_c0_g2::TRINITY_DN6930_c0_g2_i1::g.139622::m.139622
MSSNRVRIASGPPTALPAGPPSGVEPLHPADDDEPRSPDQPALRKSPGVKPLSASILKGSKDGSKDDKDPEPKSPLSPVDTGVESPDNLEAKGLSKGLGSKFKALSVLNPLFVGECKKMNHRHNKQERVVVLTHEALFTARTSGKVTRCIPLHTIQTLTVTATEMALTIPTAFDLWLLFSKEQTEDVARLLRGLKMCLRPVNPDVILRELDDESVRSHCLLNLHKPLGWRVNLQPLTQVERTLSREPRTSSLAHRMGARVHEEQNLIEIFKMGDQGSADKGSDDDDDSQSPLVERVDTKAGPTALPETREAAAEADHPPTIPHRAPGTSSLEAEDLQRRFSVAASEARHAPLPHDGFTTSEHSGTPSNPSDNHPVAIRVASPEDACSDGDEHMSTADAVGWVLMPASAGGWIGPVPERSSPPSGYRPGGQSRIPPPPPAPAPAPPPPVQGFGARLIGSSVRHRVPVEDTPITPPSIDAGGLLASAGSASSQNWGSKRRDLGSRLVSPGQPPPGHSYVCLPPQLHQQLQPSLHSPSSGIRPLGDKWDLVSQLRGEQRQMRARRSQMLSPGSGAVGR